MHTATAVAALTEGADGPVQSLRARSMTVMLSHVQSDGSWSDWAYGGSRRLSGKRQLIQCPLTSLSSSTVYLMAVATRDGAGRASGDASGVNPSSVGLDGLVPDLNGGSVYVCRFETAK
jgi:hypothetical protein